jgi:hypothetical protein|tara:strand:- start:2602 stop:2838 length:237 start_codon:yes stop_codon:yes gene_type:complete
MKTKTFNAIKKNERTNATKTVTLNVSGVSQGQWSTFILELNLMKKAWKSYGVDVDLKARSLKRIISQGTNFDQFNNKI